MKCVTHVNREAECYCPVCNQPICGECRDYLAGCLSCAVKSSRDIKAYHIRTIILSILIPVILTIIFVSDGMIGPGSALSGKCIRIILLSIFLPFGWSALNKITPNIFLILPIAGWVIYFVIKFLLALAIGWIVAIPKCISIYESIKLNKKIEANIARIKKN